MGIIPLAALLPNTSTVKLQQRTLDELLADFAEKVNTGLQQKTDQATVLRTVFLSFEFQDENQDVRNEFAQAAYEELDEAGYSSAYVWADNGAIVFRITLGK